METKDYLHTCFQARKKGTLGDMPEREAAQDARNLLIELFSVWEEANARIRGDEGLRAKYEALAMDDQAFVVDMIVGWILEHEKRTVIEDCAREHGEAAQMFLLRA